MILVTIVRYIITYKTKYIILVTYSEIILCNTIHIVLKKWNKYILHLHKKHIQIKSTNKFSLEFENLMESKLMQLLQVDQEGTVQLLLSSYLDEERSEAQPFDYFLLQILLYKL